MYTILVSIRRYLHEEKNLFPFIRAELAKRNMTLEDLADSMKEMGIIKVSASSLSNKLNGHRNFLPDEMLVISKILDSDINLLFF